MGYDLHITRRDDWSDEGALGEITIDEWLAYVASRRGWRINHVNGPAFAEFTLEQGAEPDWLNWERGNIKTKNPSKALIAEMIRIANHFNAKVQGDDGETYPQDDPNWNLFATGEHLPLLARALYTLCAVVGTVILLLTLFIVVVEITTSNTATRTSTTIALVCAILAAAHVIVEARSTRPLSIARWLAFVVAVALFAFEVWSTIADPTGRLIFICGLGIGSFALLVARVLICRRWT